MYDSVALWLSIICAFAIVGVCMYLYKRSEDTKEFIKKELKTFADHVNQSQYIEWEHSKGTMNTIYAINDKIKDIDSRINALQRNAKSSR
jgi:hypothetical protein